MKILFLDSPSFGKADMIEAFEKTGYSVKLFYDRINIPYIDIGLLIGFNTQNYLFHFLSPNTPIKLNGSILNGEYSINPLRYNDAAV